MATVLLSITKVANHYAFQLHGDATCIYAVQPEPDDTTQREQIDKISHRLIQLLSEREERRRRADEPDPLVAICRLIFTQLLPAPIRTGLAALPQGTLVSIATNDPALPWELLHDGADHLALRLAPARRLLVDSPARPVPLTPAGPLTSLLIGNPTGDLASAQDEIEQIQHLLEATSGVAMPRILMQSRATRETILQHLASGAYHLIHFAGHAHIDQEAPARSGLILANGEILTMIEIEQHLAGRPFVFLNGCESARSSTPVADPDKPTSHYDIASAFVVGGASAAIGTFWPVHDTLSKRFALDFYAQVLRRKPIAAALAEARSRSRDASPQAPLWASYLLYGEPDQTLPIPHVGEHRTSAMVVARLNTGQVGDAAAEQVPAFVQEVSACTERYGGAILSIANDEALVAFGIESTQPNEVGRALLAGASLRALLGSHKPPLRCQIGVSTGEVLVYPFAQQDRQLRLAVAGEPVASARRLAKQAPPDMILVDERVRRLTHRDFIFERPDAVWFAADSFLPCHVFIAQRPDFAGDEADLPGDRLFVGRQHKLAQLLDLWRLCQQHQGQILEIIGDPGIGKSRLVRRFLQRVTEAEPANTCLINCPATYTPAAHWLIGKLLLRLLDVAPNQPEWAMQQAMQQTLDEVLPKRQGGATQGTELALLTELVGLTPIPQSPLLADAATRRQQLLGLIGKILAWRCTTRPLIVVVDNVQWADSASRELLPALFSATERLPVFWMITLRPHHPVSAPWRERRNHSLMRLEPLHDDDSALLLAQLLDSTSVGDDVRDVVLPTAQGNPLFLRELVASLTEAGVLTYTDSAWHVVRTLAHADIPDTIQHVIRLRIDALSDAAQRVLRVLAVAGDQCERVLLEVVLHNEVDAIESGLEDLEERALIYEPVLRESYAFTHALIQDVVDHAALSEERRRLHRRIGRALEEIHRQNKTVVLDRLVSHFNQAVTWITPLGGEVIIEQADPDDLVTAMMYWGEAGAQANRRYAARQAVDCYDHALRIADVLHDRRLPVPRAAFLLGKGDAADLLGNFEDAATLYRAALDELTASPLAATSRIIAADLARRLGRLVGKLGRYDEGHSCMQQALVLLGEPQSADECTTAALILTHTASLYVWENRLNAADTACRQAIALLQNSDSGPVIATATNVLGVVCEMTGRWPEALEHLEQSRRIWAQLGDRYQEALVTDNLGTLYFYHGDFDRAQAAYANNLAFWESLNASDEIGCAHLNLGSIDLVRGVVATAADHYQRARATFELTGDAKLLAQAQTNLGFLALARDHTAEAQALFAASVAADENAENCRGLAEAQAMAQDLDGAYATASLAVALARESEMAVETGAALRVLGQIAVCQGQLERGRQTLEESRQILDGVGARYELARTLAQLANLLSTLNDPDAASSMLTEADRLFAAVGATDPNRSLCS